MTVLTAWIFIAIMLTLAIISVIIDLFKPFTFGFVFGMVIFFAVMSLNHTLQISHRIIIPDEILRFKDGTIVVSYEGKLITSNLSNIYLADDQMIKIRIINGKNLFYRDGTIATEIILD